MKKKYLVIACEVMHREICACAALSRNTVDLIFVRQALHNIGKIQMPVELQKELDSVDTERYDAVLLCYGLCNYGIRGLHADVPIVVPRAHDCITMFLGSKERYREYFDGNPGTMFMSEGWLDLEIDEMKAEDMNTYISSKFDEYVELYGEEAAEYLRDTLGNYTSEYKKYAFINTGVGDIDKTRERIKDMAKEQAWEFEEVGGDRGLIQRMLDGEWSENEFLVVAPGNHIEPSYRDDIIKAAP